MAGLAGSLCLGGPERSHSSGHPTDKSECGGLSVLDLISAVNHLINEMLQELYQCRIDRYVHDAVADFTLVYDDTNGWTKGPELNSRRFYLE